MHVVLFRCFELLILKSHTYLRFICHSTALQNITLRAKIKIFLVYIAQFRSRMLPYEQLTSRPSAVSTSALLSSSIALPIDSLFISKLTSLQSIVCGTIAVVRVAFICT